MLHVIFTRLCLGHLSVRVGDSSWLSEEIVKKKKKKKKKTRTAPLLLSLELGDIDVGHVVDGAVGVRQKESDTVAKHLKYLHSIPPPFPRLHPRFHGRCCVRISQATLLPCNIRRSHRRWQRIQFRSVQNTKCIISLEKFSLWCHSIIVK